MSSFDKNITQAFGKKGVLWLQKLPSLLGHLCQKWDLENLGPYPHLSWNYVGRALYHGRLVCLKVGIDRQQINDEYAALNHLRGDGTPEIYQCDLSIPAMLLEAAEPGTPLTEIYSRDESTVLRHYTSAIKRMRSAPPLTINHSFPHLRQWLIALHNVRSDRPEITNLIEQARQTASSLLSHPDKDRLLHGDLHLGNILLSHSDILVIDPKGIVGPEAFEVTCFNLLSDSDLSLPTAEAYRKAHERISQLASLLSLDRTTLAKWFFVRLVLALCWMIEDNGCYQRFLQLVRIIFPQHSSS